MVRQTLKKKQLEQSESGFRFRGTTNTRIEAFSDAVFAIATALLIISSTIPETYDELILFFNDLIPFAICITLMIMIWYEHYVFFIRYGFKDASIVALNTFLLFQILIYVYPLKFLFKLLYQMFPAMIFKDQQTINHLFTEIMPLSKTNDLMVIYGLGAAGIFYTLSFMYYVAYRRRKRLALNDLEIFDTKVSMFSNVLSAAIPTLSVLISLFHIGGSFSFALSGLTYLLYGLVMPIFGINTANRRVRLLNTQ